jgi:hypothetical protein
MPSKKNKYRSGLEESVAKALTKLKCKFAYEQDKIRYTKPITYHTYLPDFVLPNGIIIEVKGKFSSSDRLKHLLIQKQYPLLDIRFVFGRSSNKLYKCSPTTYATWCEKHGFKYADKTVPEEWINERKKPKHERISEA